MDTKAIEILRYLNEQSAAVTANALADIFPVGGMGIAMLNYLMHNVRRDYYKVENHVEISITDAGRDFLKKLDEEKEKAKRPLHQTTITGSGNIVGDSNQPFFDNSFNRDLPAENPINQESKEQKKITPSTILESLWEIISNNPLISAIIALIVGTVVLKYVLHVI